MSKVGLAKVVKVIRMAIDAPDPLRQVLDSRHAVQQFVPASLASGFPCSCLCGLRGLHAYWISASSFFCISACAFVSSSTSLSRQGGFSEDDAQAKSPTDFLKNKMVLQLIGIPVAT